MDPESDLKPRLRNIEPVQLAVNGRTVVGLKDPLQLKDQVICLQPEALPIVAMMDGRHSLRDIQEELTRRTGRLVFLDDIKAVVKVLTEGFLLEGEVFQEAFARKVAEYRCKPFRPASHSGMSYSADAQELQEELRDFFVRENGPGIPDFYSDARRPVGLIAPHIDIRAGGSCFAAGYHALAQGQPSDVYVIFGTGHAGLQQCFTATTLDFRTPLGTVETDREMIHELSELMGCDVAAEEIMHATEHVIEFQAIFLQYLFAGRRPFKIVPFLCSFSHHLFGDDRAFSRDREIVERFCSALKEVCRRSSKSICFVASADLDHIGPRYGDRFVPHQGTVSKALEKDRKLIQSLERVDLDAFIRGVAEENDARRICGFPPITTMLSCMEASQGKLLALDHALVDDKNSFVSFTSMIFH
ncbi:MAG: AmmeMemoRadiSam system protein B [Desulfomonile tiedjei]|nr:AmmeMemoRadiSam system protein B [Desulfomonile tiedjei]